MHDLRGFERRTESQRLVKIVGAVVAVAIFGLLAGYSYEQGQLATRTKEIVTDQELPSPSPPVMPQRT